MPTQGEHLQFEQIITTSRKSTFAVLRLLFLLFAAFLLLGLEVRRHGVLGVEGILLARIEIDVVGVTRERFRRLIPLLNEGCVALFDGVDSKKTCMNESVEKSPLSSPLSLFYL